VTHHESGSHGSQSLLRPQRHSADLWAHGKRCIYIHTSKVSTHKTHINKQTNTHTHTTHTHTHTHTHIHTHTHTVTNIYTNTHRQTDRQTNRQTHIYTPRICTLLLLVHVPYLLVPKLWLLPCTAVVEHTYSKPGFFHLAINGPSPLWAYTKSNKAQVSGREFNEFIEKLAVNSERPSREGHRGSKGRTLNHHNNAQLCVQYIQLVGETPLVELTADGTLVVVLIVEPARAHPVHLLHVPGEFGTASLIVWVLQCITHQSFVVIKLVLDVLEAGWCSLSLSPATHACEEVRESTDAGDGGERRAPARRQREYCNARPFYAAHPLRTPTHRHSHTGTQPPPQPQPHNNNNIHTSTPTHTHTHTHTRHIQTHTYSYTHPYTHTHTHMHIQRRTPFVPKPYRPIWWCLGACSCGK
jgi:hypothetical protein